MVRIIQTRRCSMRKHAKLTKFLKVAIRTTKPELLKKRKKRTRAIIIRTKHTSNRCGGLTYQFVDNALVLLKRRMNTMGKEILGPTSREFRIKKFKVAFKFIF